MVFKYFRQSSKVRFEQEASSDKAVFQIVGQGIDIALEDQTRLFEIFYTTKNAGTIFGTAPRLAIVKKSAELPFGKLVLCTWMGFDTTFTFNFF